MNLKLINSEIKDRSLIILPCFEGETFFVYNGKIYVQLFIKKEMVGHKFGEFIFTTQRPVFKAKKKKKN